MKYFIDPFRKSCLSQTYNGGKFDKIIEEMKRQKNEAIIRERNSEFLDDFQNNIEEKDEVTNIHKWIISIFLGVIFLIFSFTFLIFKKHMKILLFINVILFILFIRLILL